MPDVPEILELKRLLSDLPASLSWEQLWDLRMKVSELLLGANQETRSMLQTIYNKLTVLLKNRAEELGKGDTFAELERLTQLDIESKIVLGQLRYANSTLEFFDILNEPARQNEITALQSFTESGGAAKNYLNEVRDSTKAAYGIAKSARAGARLSLRDVLGFAIQWFRSKRQLHDK